MSYNLEITFTGLFTFVPHTTRNRLYVLLPTTRDTPHHHVPELRHRKLTEPAVLFAREHLRLDGIGDGAGTTIDVPDEACDLCEVTGKRLPAKQVEHEPTDRVRLRIELPPADSIVARQSAKWHIVRKRPLSHEIIWTRRGLSLPQITFMRRMLVGTSVETPLSFQPQGNTMRLFFRHLPHSDMCIEEGEEALHFGIYYSLYDPPETGPNPILAQPRPFPCPSNTHTRKRKRRNYPPPPAANVFTCMTSQVPVG